VHERVCSRYNVFAFGEAVQADMVLEGVITQFKVSYYGSPESLDDRSPQQLDFQVIVFREGPVKITEREGFRAEEQIWNCEGRFKKISGGIKFFPCVLDRESRT
jgi:hypothetical protein